MRGSAFLSSRRRAAWAQKHNSTKAGARPPPVRATNGGGGPRGGWRVVRRRKKNAGGFVNPLHSARRFFSPHVPQRRRPRTAPHPAPRPHRPVFGVIWRAIRGSTTAARAGADSHGRRRGGVRIGQLRPGAARPTRASPDGGSRMQRPPPRLPAHARARAHPAIGHAHTCTHSLSRLTPAAVERKVVAPQRGRPSPAAPAVARVALLDGDGAGGVGGGRAHGEGGAMRCAARTCVCVWGEGWGECGAGASARRPTRGVVRGHTRGEKNGQLLRLSVCGRSTLPPPPSALPKN